MTLAERAAALGPEEIVALVRSHDVLVRQKAELEARTGDLTRQLEWFKRQLFGRKSERRVREPDPQQLPLGLVRSAPNLADAPPPPTETVKAYQRRAPFTALATGPDESGLRFDASVPVEVITVPSPEAADFPPEAYEVISEKVTYRLA